jgi:hypothetical protein
MGGVGSTFDKAMAESCFATLKAELVYLRAWPTPHEREMEVFSYIDGFYNPRSRHSQLDNLSLALRESKWLSTHRYPSPRQWPVPVRLSSPELRWIGQRRPGVGLLFTGQPAGIVFGLLLALLGLARWIFSSFGVKHWDDIPTPQRYFVGHGCHSWLPHLHRLCGWTPAGRYADSTNSA